MSSRPVLPHFGLLSVLAIVNAAAIALRVAHTGKVTFVFLAWNLFLAGVPYLAACALQSNWRESKRLTPGGVALGALWLLFFPNAPYVLTDFVHLHGHGNQLWWYDVLLLATSAGTAWLLGLISLQIVHDVLSGLAGKRAAWLTVGVVAWLTGLGVYLGRFLRFNSWDIARNPLPLASAILDRFVHPLAHPRTHVFAAFYALLLALSFWLYRSLATQSLALGDERR